MSERPQFDMSVTFHPRGNPTTLNTKYSQVSLLNTRDQGMVLLMNEEAQLAETDEHRYHEMLVHPALHALPSTPTRVLILGGGDGCAAREALKWKQVTSVTVVDYDEEFIQQMAIPILFKLNADSLTHYRVRLVFMNALTYVRNTPDSFDCILIDLPDPDTHDMAQLYIDILYACQRILRPDGIVGMHTGPLSLKKGVPCWRFVKSLRDTAKHVYGSASGFHFRSAHIPSFVHPWGFAWITTGSVPESPALSIVPHLCRWWEPTREEHRLIGHVEIVGDRDVRFLYEEANQ